MMKKVLSIVMALLLVGAAQATIIGGAIGNGDFSDFSGGWVEAGGTAGVNGTAPDYTRIWRSAGTDLTSGIDGWTARYRGGYVSFDTRTDMIQPGDATATPNKSFNLNQWSNAILTSDAYAVSLVEGDELKLSFDTSGNLMRITAYLIFDEGLASEMTRFIVGNGVDDVDGYEDFITTDHTDLQNAGDFFYTLDIGESASTVTLVFGGYRSDQGGLDYGMIKRNNGTGCLDNVDLSVVPEPATMVLLGLGGLLIRRKK